MKKAAYLLLPFVCMALSCSKDEGGFAKDEFGRISQTAYLPDGMPDNVAVFHNEWNPAAEVHQRRTLCHLWCQVHSK